MEVSEGPTKKSLLELKDLSIGQAFKYGSVIFIKMEVGPHFNIPIDTDYPEQCFVYNTQADCLAIFNEDHLVDRVYTCCLKIK